MLTVSGTPNATGTVTLNVSVTDSASDTPVSQTYSINVVSGPDGAHNSYLSGTYVCKTDSFFDNDGSRWTTLSSLQIAGDGSLTGVFDMNGRDMTSAIAGSTIGTYSVGSDNNGIATTTATIAGVPGTISSQWALALSNLGEPGTPAQEFRMLEADDVGATPSGRHGNADCYRATTSAFTDDTINGKSFAFGVQGENGNGTPKAYVGRFSASSGSLNNGILDGMRVDQSADDGGTFGGSYATVSSTSGRFMLTFTQTGGGASMAFAGYVIDANRMFILETAGDSGVLAGDLRTQLQSSYSGANLNGAFVLYAQSYRYDNGTASVHDSEVFQGTGNSTGGLTINQSYMNDNGTYSPGNANGASVDVSFDSSYAGRATFASGNGHTSFWYFYDNNAALEMDLGSGYLQTGWVEAQTQTTFTNEALAGTYLFGQMSPMQANQNSNVGEFTLLSNGNMTGGGTHAGAGSFSYDQTLSFTYEWDTSTTNTGTFLVGTVNNGGSCAVISASKAVCVNDGDSMPAVLIFQK
jgi:hypothetical protein